MTTLPQPRHDLDLALLGGRDDAVALCAADTSLTYAELADAVRREAVLLGPERRVVVLEARNDVATVVRLLAAWAGHHPVVLLGADDAERHHEIAERYAGVRGADLHPDLALLLSTSGSTGSPKLVRLSRPNVLANARSIADYLDLTPHDRAITSLPLHYCYGLSVLTSHLVAGAAVVLTDLSVADRCFWDLAASARVTGFAGVPYTFDLLDAGGFAARDLPDLRYVTQAGGRLAPDAVRRFAALGRRAGWDLYVMYGATEATARMAYLPPGLASSRPEAIGVPVLGGDFRLAPVEGADDGSGELVYTGPNVMMGYAEGPADLARGAELVELRTGDLARQADDGLWEVLGRLDRHAKVFGLRLDLDRLEAGAPHRTALVTVGDHLHAFVDRPRAADDVRRALVQASGLPPSAVRVHTLSALPTTARGKVDHAALRRHATAADAVAGTDDEDRSPATAAALRDLYAVVLARPDATVDDSFVSLGGDSLSFVEVSTRLGRRLDHLPDDWHHRSLRDLAATARRPRRRLTPVEVPSLLRAVAIVMIVLSHTDLLLVLGGAHVLLAVAGYNVARFALGVEGRRRRVRRVLSGLASVAVPAAVWIAGVGAVTGDYQPTTALFLNQSVGSDTWTDDWHFWFLEVLVWGHLGLVALLLVPAFDRWQRRHRFGAAVTVLVA
ncbi:MAG: AMP-dependent synthetase and ligase, partial [Nocardioides sp.]|nr:AMP-dependent synthetase and ligase [Nocardioides sp.]